MILVDNTVLSNFALAGSLQCLRLFCRGRGLTTEEVFEEFRAGATQGLFADTDLTWLRRTRLHSAPERRLFQQCAVRLGAGESSCLAVAIQRRHSLLTDDMDARKIALREGVSLSGSVGVLVAQVRREILDLAEANEVLQAMIASGYYSPVEKLDGLI